MEEPTRVMIIDDSKEKEKIFLWACKTFPNRRFVLIQGVPTYEALTLQTFHSGVIPQMVDEQKISSKYAKLCKKQKVTN